MIKVIDRGDCFENALFLVQIVWRIVHDNPLTVRLSNIYHYHV
jgi:hypothetical protein